MAGLVPAIHDLMKKDVDARHIGGLKKRRSSNAYVRA
jgi:hypothetical protein